MGFFHAVKQDIIAMKAATKFIVDAKINLNMLDLESSRLLQEKVYNKN